MPDPVKRTFCLVSQLRRGPRLVSCPESAKEIGDHEAAENVQFPP